MKYMYSFSNLSKVWVKKWKPVSNSGQDLSLVQLSHLVQVKKAPGVQCSLKIGRLNLICDNLVASENQYSNVFSIVGSYQKLYYKYAKLFIVIGRINYETLKSNERTYSLFSKIRKQFLNVRPHIDLLTLLYESRPSPPPPQLSQPLRNCLGLWGIPIDSP
jgi:hypothetical protein